MSDRGRAKIRNHVNQPLPGYSNNSHTRRNLESRSRQQLPYAY